MHEREVLQKYLHALNIEFGEYLSNSLSARAVRKHCSRVSLFVDFVCWDTDTKNIEGITKGIANSYFRRWYMSKIADCTETELKTSIKKFFLFLHIEKGIKNEVVLKSFKLL